MAPLNADKTVNLISICIGTQNPKKLGYHKALATMLTG